ncbi:type II toxin-antitoxin system RelB/DinJ family antitoxin [Yersinia similis]|uniref:type II toxin-antitoxin system RelB/DinJ family antitoxin n=1 Tax=Yersinia similis TaxID=367190 RepID=UPI003850E7CC
MATITVRIDDELKQNFDDVLNELKISQTEVIINTCKYIVQNKKLPFVVIEKLKTPEELRREILDKFNTAYFVIRDLASNQKNNNPIYPKHCRIIISTLRGFTDLFNSFDEAIENAIPRDEYKSLLAACGDALYIANRLDHSVNYSGAEYVLLTELTTYINIAVISFGRVLSIGKDIIRHFQVKLIENNIAIKHWDTFEARLTEALEEGTLFQSAVINLVMTGRKQGIRLRVRDNSQSLDAETLHHALIPFGFSREQAESIINNCQTDISGPLNKEIQNHD